MNERQKSLVARDFSRIFASIKPHATIADEESVSGRAGAMIRNEIDIEWGGAEAAVSVDLIVRSVEENKNRVPPDSVESLYPNELIQRMYVNGK